MYSKRKRRTQGPSRLALFIGASPHGISFESSASLLQKCRRHRQVFLGRAEIDMSQVRRQFWQQLCDVCSCFVGRDQAVDTEGMAKMPNSAFAAECRVPENAE